MILDNFFDFVFGHGKICAFCSIAIAVFIASFIMFFILMSPFAIWKRGMPWDMVFAGAIGCGIGSGLVNGIFAAWFA